MQKPKKLHKVRRFIWRVLKYTTLSVLVLLISLFFIFQMHSVQTWMGKKVSTYLSKELKTTISVKAVKINFFKTVDLEGIYAEDMHHDTLMFGNKLSVEIKLLSIGEKEIDLDLTKLEGITCKLQKYKGEKDLNFQFLIDYFASSNPSPTDTSGVNFKIKYGDLSLSNVRFVYHDFNDTAKQAHGINYSHLEVNNVTGKISDIRIAGDSIKCVIADFSCVEKSGLRVKKLYTHATVSPKNIRADSLLLHTEHSYLHGFYRMRTDSFADYPNYVQAVNMETYLRDSSYVNPSDVAYFTDFFRGLDLKININGYIKGPVADLNSDDLKFSFGRQTGFSGKFNIKGLPDIEKTFIKVEAKKLSTHYADLSTAPSYPFHSGKTLELPANLKKLGLVTFSGKVEGFINDLFLGGIFTTALGKITTNATVNTKSKDLAYSGNFKTESFNIGAFFEVDKLDEVSLNCSLKGSGTDLNTLQAQIKASVFSARYNNYVYHGVEINGSLKKKLFDGSFNSTDLNANLDFTGTIDLRKKIPQIEAEFNLYNFNLYACHFVKTDSTVIMSGKTRISLQGQNLDNINGTVQTDRIKLVKSNSIIKLDNTDITIIQNETQNSLSMISSVADLEISGKFKSETLQKSITLFLHDYFPTFFSEKETANSSLTKKEKLTPVVINTDNLNFKIRIKDFEPVTKYLNIPLTISRNTTIQGSFDAQKNALIASGLSDKIEYNKIPIRDWFLSISTTNKQVKLNTGFRRVDFADSVYIGNFNFEANSTDNKSVFEILWDNQSKQKNSGEIEGNLVFSQYHMDLDIQKFFIYAADSLWKRVGSDHFFADSSGTFNFSDLTFVNNTQRIKLEGVISKNPKDQIVIELDNFKLNQLRPILKRSGVNLGGTLSGTTNISDLYNKVIFSSALAFTRLTANNTLIGTGEINSFFNKTKNLVSLNGFVKREFEKIAESSYNNVSFDGYYFPDKKDSAIDINVHLNQFALSTLQPFVKGIFTFDKGSLNGNVNIKGSSTKPQITGLLDLADVSNLKIDYLNAAYKLNGNIKIEPDKFVVENLILTDIHNNKATVWGDIFHDNFTNIKLDFDINTINFMALNTTPAQNSSYYGKAFCTGNIGLYGPPDALTIDINAKTSKGTQFFIPLAGPEEVSENGFIRFVKIDSISKKSHGTKNDFSGLTLKFNLEATPDAEVQILFDAKAGDAIKARGMGNINMNINTLGGFEMFGTYTITDGSYLFTLENVINKKFDVDAGSTIRWSGDPLNADINITASYKQRASLAAFFPPIPADQSAATGGTSTPSSTPSSTGVDNNKRYPVDVKLYMRNKLLSPDITFGIELPTVTEVIRSQVLSYINNEQELNRQVFSLLLLRTFVTPLQLDNTSGVSAGNAVGNNASELLSNQLNAWLSHFTKVFNLGVNYRPGGAQSNEEYALALSTQLFNDKLSIDGNVGVNNNNQTKTSTLIGDLNMNYKLTNDGKLQLKAFNRSNDNFQIATSGGQFTQGAGVLYREEFNSLGEVYKRYVNFIAGKKKK